MSLDNFFLKDILGIKNGYAFSSKKFNSEGIGMPLIRIRDLSDGFNTKTFYNGDYKEEYLIKKGDLLIGMDGEFKCYEWKGNNALLNQRVCKLHSFDKSIDKKYLLYGINSKLKLIEDVTSYTTVKHISSKQIGNIMFSFPSLSEQKQIVETLDKAFEKIDKAIANAMQNQQNAKELFESYLQNVFENKGDNWKVKKLNDVCVVERGSSPRPIKKFITDDDNGVNWIKIGDTKNIEKYIYETKQKITKKGAEKSRYVEEGDFILSNSMSFGKPYIVKTKGYIHDGWFKLKLHDFVDTEYFYQLLSSRYVNDQFHRLASGSVVKNISGDLVKKVVLPIAPIIEQKEIVQKLNSLSIKTKKLEAFYTQKINDLEKLKKSILEKAFKGELTSAA